LGVVKLKANLKLMTLFEKIFGYSFSGCLVLGILYFVVVNAKVLVWDSAVDLFGDYALSFVIGNLSFLLLVIAFGLFLEKK